jgi:hypothetical protein
MSQVNTYPAAFLCSWEAGVITMDQIGWIRRLHCRENKSEREISRTTGLSRNTVDKWLHADVSDPPKYRRTPQPCKLTPFVEMVKQTLRADARRPKQERHAARALHAELKAAGYGGYTRLRDFFRAWRADEGQRPASTPSCRWPSSSARRSSSTGARKDWWWAASTTGCRWRT